VGHKSGKQRDINLISEPRQPLFAYLERIADLQWIVVCVATRRPPD
jgi:hypothetical protein